MMKVMSLMRLVSMRLTFFRTCACACACAWSSGGRLRGLGGMRGKRLHFRSAMSAPKRGAHTPHLIAMSGR